MGVSAFLSRCNASEIEMTHLTEVAQLDLQGFGYNLLRRFISSALNCLVRLCHASHYAAERPRRARGANGS
jgi:hypothetical protein